MSKPLTAKEMLETCSTYSDASGGHFIDFNPPREVVLYDMTPTSRIPGKKAADRTAARRGVYAIDPQTQNVVVEIDAKRTTFVAFSPPGLSGCLLVSGSLDAAKLNDSWFGELDPPGDS